MPKILYAHTGSNPDDCATWQTLADHCPNAPNIDIEASKYILVGDGFAEET